MATRNQVLSLFGASPEQVMERQRQQQAEFLASQRDGFQQSGAAIGLGLARLFGGKSPEMEAAEQMQAAIAGVDPNDPAALRELAKTVSSFAPERALQIAAYAGELEKSKQGSVVNVPTKVGQKPIYKQDAKTLEWSIVGYEDQYENIPHERTADGLKPLVDISQYGAKAATDTGTEQPQAQVPDYITNEQGVVVRNPAKTGEATTPTTTQSTPAATAQPAPTQEPFVPQQGRIITDPAEIARLEQSLLTPGAQAAPRIAQTLPQGEIEYADPEALQEASDALRDQIVALEKSNDKNKAAKIKRLKKRRAEIQKQRIASRRRGAPADLQATGQVSDVFSGFRNAK